MGKMVAPIAGGKAFMWEGFGSVANNNITTPIKPLYWERITALIYCAATKEEMAQ